MEKNNIYLVAIFISEAPGTKRNSVNVSVHFRTVSYQVKPCLFTFHLMELIRRMVKQQGNRALPIRLPSACLSFQFSFGPCDFSSPLPSYDGTSFISCHLAPLKKLLISYRYLHVAYLVPYPFKLSRKKQSSNHI